MQRFKKILKELAEILVTILVIFLLLNNKFVRPEIKSIGDYYKIEKREHKLLAGITGHTFIEMRDEKENVLYQMHGFATDENNNYKFIGNKVTDRLKVWEFDHDLYKDTRNLDIGDTGVILATGTKDYINLLWDQSKVCMSDINEKDILYPRYGFRLFGETENSNSVADTLISCMQLKNRDIGLITPGRDVILIE